MIHSRAQHRQLLFNIIFHMKSHMDYLQEKYSKTLSHNITHGHSSQAYAELFGS